MSAKTAKLTSAQKDVVGEVTNGLADGTLDTRTLRSAVKKAQGKKEAKNEPKAVRGGWGLFQKIEGAKLPASMPFVDRTRTLGKKWAVADKDKWSARAEALNRKNNPQQNTPRRNVSRRNASRADDDDEDE